MDECTNKNCRFYAEDYTANCMACTDVSDEPLFAQGCEMSSQPPTSEPPSEPGDVEDIIKQWLKDNGYDGLFYENDCGCWMDRFRPYGESMAECVPGHKYKCTDQDSEFFDAWCIGPKEPTPE